MGAEDTKVKEDAGVAEEKNYSEMYKPKRDVRMIKKDGTREAFNVQKVIDAVGKSAYRALTKFTEKEKDFICEKVVERVDELDVDEASRFEVGVYIAPAVPGEMVVDPLGDIQGLTHVDVVVAVEVVLHFGLHVVEEDDIAAGEDVVLVPFAGLPAGADHPVLFELFGGQGSLILQDLPNAPLFAPGEVPDEHGEPEDQQEVEHRVERAAARGEIQMDREAHVRPVPPVRS